MSDFERTDPPHAASELATLSAFLDYHRVTLLQKVAGVSDADLRRSPLSGLVPGQSPDAEPLTLLGLVKHLAYVERWWFAAVFAGETVAFPWTDADPNADFRIEPDETTEAILELYRAEVEKARQIVRTAVQETGSETTALAALSKNPAKADYSLRWIIVHMIEETARHNGHADILRELTDGVTGE